MAGGQNNQSHNGTFGRRLAAMPAGAPVREPEQTPTGAPEVRYPRHCWVVGVPRLPDRWPGLLLAWEQTEAGWIGRVVFAYPAEGPGQVVVDRWLAEQFLEPA